MSGQWWGGPGGGFPCQERGIAPSERSVEIRVRHSDGLERADRVVAEEPLEVRIEGRPVAVTMRTPGDDLDLAAGFLYTEGVIEEPDDVVALAHVGADAGARAAERGGRGTCNVVDVRLASGVPAARRHRADRELYASSSCGICGKRSLDRIFADAAPLASAPRVRREVLLALPERMRAAQAVFQATGGLHAAALFSFEGALEVLREDVGRHNAVDKVIGWRLRQDRLPVDDRVLLVSGRAGFEIVQKAFVARIPLVAAVGPPSSLAVELARRAGMTLVGFLRHDRFNCYAGSVSI